MSTIVITDRDIEILKMVSRVGFLTETQICALFYSKCEDFTLDIKRARGSLSKRIYQLVQASYLAKSSIPTSGTINRVAYLLGPEGAEVLRDTREIEIMQDSRWLQRRSNGILIRSRHDLVATNFLVNLIMLSRLLQDFHLVDWIPDRECRFYIPHREKKLVVNPDLYLIVMNGSPERTSIFIEVDNDTLARKALHIKLTRYFQYYSSRKYKRDLALDHFPRICILVPSSTRLEVMKAVIMDAKKSYSGAVAENVARMPFCITTYDKAEVNSLDQGFITKKPLASIWVNENGQILKSPLLS